MARVRVLKLVSEDPWVAEPLWESEELGQFEVFDKFDEVLDKYIREGWECFDYGAASVQLCVKGTEKVVIGIWLGQMPEEAEPTLDPFL
ncbi:hypothetical protein J7M00_02465 [bacterium]|nr:hypothetical protein [bacterium]